MLTTLFLVVFLMTMDDFSALSDAFEEALRHRELARLKLLQESRDGHVTACSERNWIAACKEVECTGRDLEYCMDLELASMDD